MTILQGKNLLITGVLTDDSLAFGVAKEAQAHGANVVLSGFGRGMRLTERTARKLETTPEIIELDVTNVRPDCRRVPTTLQARSENSTASCMRWGLRS